jgi:hypothetical protein
MVNFFIWVFIKAWPVFSFVLILLIHILFMYLPCLNSEFFCYDNSQINKVIAFSMQLFGGLLILFSIDSNIELFKNNSLLGMVKSWYGQRPWKALEAPRGVEGSVSITLPPIEFSGRGHAGPTTLEGKLDLLEKKIDWINEDIKKNQQKTNEELQGLQSLLNQNNNKQSHQIKKLQNDLIQSSVGGVKLQVFGVLLVFYSSILSFFA